MRVRQGIVVFISLIIAIHSKAQDTAKYLQEVFVTGIKTIRGTGHMPEIKNGIIYAGKRMKLL